LSQDAEVGAKWNAQRGCRASHLRGIMAQTPQGALKRHKGPLRSLGLLGCLSVICLPQSSACQRSLVEVRPTIPVCTLVGSVGLCVRLGLSGASNP
jgi:hypothetical protein